MPSICSLIAPTVVIFLTLATFAAPRSLSADEGSAQCMQDLLNHGEDSLTLGEIRARCAPAEEVEVAPDTLTKADKRMASVNRRLAAERKAAASPFSILAHKPNYVLAGAYNEKGWSAEDYQLGESNPDYENKDVESQFQISLKVPLAIDLFSDRLDIYAAYTNRSFWQVYNSEFSEPFRETNHEPEVWVQLRNDWQIFGLTNAINTFGFVHQSNGQAGLQSRSWNRMYANFIFQKDNFVLSFKPWIWLSKDKSISDNPDITDYMGHGEVRAAWSRNRPL